MEAQTQASLLTLYEKGRGLSADERLNLFTEHLLHDVPDATIGDLDRAVWALREDALGRPLTAVMACPDCGAEVEIDLPEGLNIPSSTSRAVTVEFGNKHYQLRLPRPADLIGGPIAVAGIAADAPWDDSEFIATSEAALEAAELLAWTFASR